MADISKVYDEAVKNGLLDPAVSQDEFKNIMGNAQMRKAYFDFVQEHKRGFYGDDYDKFSSAAERMVGGSSAPSAVGAAPAMPAMPAMPAAGGNPRVADYPAPTNAAEEEANRINQNFGSENNLQIGAIENAQRPLEQYSAEGLETRRKQILDAAERKKQQRIREQEQWEQEHPFFAALSGMSHGGAMPAPSAKEALMETPTDMFTGKQQGQLRAIEDELGQRAGELYIPQAKEAIKQSEEFVAKVRANNKDLSVRQKANLGSAEYLLTKANEIANAGSKFDDSKAMANWWEGLKNDLFDRDISAVWGVQRDIRVNDIVEKVNNGEELTDDEAALLNAYFTLATATEARQFDLSTGYQIGQGTAQSVPFMIDMYLTRGAGAWGKKQSLKALSKAAKFKDLGSVERWLQMADKAGEAGKMGTRDIARKASYEGIATPLQTALMPSSWRQMQQEATQMRLERGENDLSLLDKTRIFTNATKETLTERVGGDVIDWGLGRVFGKMTQPWRLGGKGQFAVNKYIQSPIGETGEEYIGALIDLARSYNPLYDDESNQQLRDGADEMFSWEGLGKTFGTVLPMSILGGAANMAELRYNTGKMEKAREDIISRLQQAVGMSEEDARHIMAYTESAGTAEEFADRLDIVGRNIANAYEYMGADVETKGKDGKTSGVIGGLQQELNDYAMYAASVNKIVEQFSADYDKLSDDEKQNAKQLLERAQQDNRNRNILIEAGNLAIQEVNGVKNGSNNYLYNVSFADGSLQDGESAFVVGGNVAVTHNDDGAPMFDKAASEDEVVSVRIMHKDGTSEVKQVSVGELDLVQEPITAEEYLNERTNALYAEMVAAADEATAPTEDDEHADSSAPVGTDTVEGTATQPQKDVVRVVGYTTDGVFGREAKLSAPINIGGTITTIVPESMLDEIMTSKGYTKTEDGTWVIETAQQTQAVEPEQQPLPIAPEQPQPKAEPQQPQAENANHVPFAENLAAAPRNEQGKVDYAKIESADELARVVTAEMRGRKDVAKRYMEAKAKLASDTLKKTKHKNEDLDDPDAFLAVEQTISDLKNEVNRWNTAITALNSIRTAEEQAAYEAEQEHLEAQRKARKQTETGSAGNNGGTMASRYAAAPKIDGNTGTITAANGQVLKGHYVLVSADGLTPSHDARNGFDMSEGYPTVDGKSINDRDYKNDPEEQAKVQQIAQQYNGNAIKNMPIVSDEGLVYNGNGRTMAGQLAAQQGTDGAYKQALTDNAAQFGFTAEQVASVPNARVVFQTDERLPYNTTTLALFNATEQQTQSNTAKAAANTRKLTPEAVGHIINAISGFDNTDAFFSHNKAPFDLINTLIADGVMTDRDKASLIDGDRLSGAGKDVLMGVLFGTAFDEKTIRLLADNAQVQNSVMRALPQILENKGLGEYSLFDHINNAIAAIYVMRKRGMSFFEFTRQTVLFGSPASTNNYTEFEMLLADEMMNGGVAAFREVLTKYNEQAKQLAGGQMDIFGELTPRENIENAIVEYYKNKRNGQENQQNGRAESPEQPSARQGDGETEPAVAGTREGDGRPQEDVQNTNTTYQEQLDSQGNPIDNDGNLIVEEVESVYDITDEDFDNPSRNVALPAIPHNIAVALGINDRPIVIKKNIFEKNRDTHEELSPEDSRGILVNALYNTNLYGQSKPISRPSYRVAIQTGIDKNDIVVIDVYQNNDKVEIVGWRYINEKGLNRLKKQVEREDGQLLILSPSSGSAAALSALPSNAVSTPVGEISSVSDKTTDTTETLKGKQDDTALLQNTAKREEHSSSTGKGTKKSANDQTNPKKSAEKVENARGNGENAVENKIFTEDMYEDARRRMHERLNRLNAGLDPEMLSDGLIMAGYHVEKGARKFVDFAKKMIEEFGDKIRPYLKSFYNGLRDMPEAIELSKEMDDYGTVSSFDVNSIGANEDKQEEQPIDTANMTRSEVAAEIVRRSKKTKKEKEKGNVNTQQDGQLGLFSDTETQKNNEKSLQNEKKLVPLQSNEVEYKLPDGRTLICNKDDYATFTTPKAKAFFAEYTLTDSQNKPCKIPECAYISYASKAGAIIPADVLMQDPNVQKAQAKIDAKKGQSLELTDEQVLYYAIRLLDDEHGSLVYLPNGKKNKRNGEDDYSGKVDTGKKAFIVIGRPAGGKSSVYAEPLSAKHHARIIDSDTVKPWLDGFDNGYGAGYVQKASSDVMEAALDIAIERGENVVIPKIGGGSIVEMAENLRKKGYSVELYYNEVSEESSIMRATARFAETGRYLEIGYLKSIGEKPNNTFRKYALSTIEEDENGNQIIRTRETHVGGFGQEAGLGESRTNRSNVLFERAEWKNNQVKIGEPPLLVWSSESGEPMPGAKSMGTPNQVSVEGLFADLYQNGQAKLSDHIIVGGAGISNQKSDKNNGSTEVRNHGRGETNAGETKPSGQSTDADGALGGSQQPSDERLATGGVDSGSKLHRLHDGERGGATAVQPARRSVNKTENAHPKSERRNTRNFRARNGERLSPITPKARYDANIAAISLLKQLQEEGRQATTQEMDILSQYSGWGGLGEFFKGEPGTTYYSMRGEKSPYQTIKELLTDDEMEAAQLSRLSAYYTPDEIIRNLWKIAEHLGFKGGNILEGSAGTGNILAWMPADISHNSNLTAIEIDDITAGILAQLYPDADVHHAGFQEVDIPNNSQDLVITNVPFVTGLRVYDKVEKDLSKRFGNIHDFCIAKNVRKLKQGGLGIFISSSGTLDKSKELRVWLNGEGETDVIGAFRLNNSTFEGTSVTSDIIVVRKRVNGQKDPRAIDVLDTKTGRIVEQEQEEVWDKKNYKYVKPESKPVKLIYNGYFVENPTSMGGEMGFGFEHGSTWRETTTGCYAAEHIDQDKRLSEWIKSIDSSVQLPSYKDVEEGKKVARGTYEEYKGVVPYGSLILNSKGEICKAYHGEAIPVEGINSNKVKGHSKEEVLKDYNAIKEAISSLLDVQQTEISDEELKPYLDRLNKAYDTFVSKYGSLNKNTSIAFLRNDVQWASIAAIEKVKETVDIHGKKHITVSKTDLFEKRVVGVPAKPKADNTRDGIILSMQQFGIIRPDKIAEWLGKTTDEVKKEIIDTRLGFVNPQTGDIQVRHEYLSGNVREKLAYAEQHNENGELDANIEELRKVIPIDIPAHLIEFNIGSTWIPKELYIEYAREKYDLGSFQLNHVGSAWIANEVWGRNEKNRSGGVYSDMLGIQVYGHELMLAAMNNVPVVVSKTEKYRDGTTETRTDKSASAACSDKISQIKDDFVEWARGKMQQDAELAESVQKQYNERFNAIVPMLRVDEAFLSQHLIGQNSGKYSLYPHQQQAVARGLTQSLMLAHEVGTGKTISLISIAMEMRRLGTAKKPMIVVQNATTQQFVADAKDLYPNAKILTVNDRDRTSEGRQEFYAKIKYNDWDLIIVPQSVFDMIPDSESRMQDFINEKIEEKIHAIEAAKEAGVDDKVTSRMEKELEMLREDLENNNMSGKRSGKKKEKDAKKEAEQRANAEARAQEMLDRRTDDVEDFDSMGIDALLIDEAHNYKHLGFATMMTRGVKGIDPSYSKRAAALYLKCQSVYERNGHRNVIFATGTPISNTAAEIWTFMKYLMPKSVMQENEIYYFDDFVHNFGKISEQLEFATNGKFKANNRFAQYGNVPELMRLWLSVADCTLTREVGQVNDKVPELEGGTAQDIFLPQSPSLIDIMASVRAELEKYENMSGKEKKENSHIPLTMYGIAKRAAIDPRLVDSAAIDEPLSKTNRAVEEVIRSLNDSKQYNGTVAIFCDSYQNKQSGFNLFEDIKDKLIKKGIPSHQIAIIRSEMSDTAKQKIFDAVREGDIRVIMGSTQTLGTGVNIQTRLHTLIHMDAPDRPMDYTQRNGRILRQGNMHKEWNIPVRVLRFGVEDSLDVTSYQRLKTKSGFIDSIMNGKSMIDNNLENRVLEDVDEGIFDNPVAMLSGSQFALLKSQAERDLRKWSSREQQYKIDQILIAKKTKDNEKIIESRKQKIASNNKLIVLLEETFPNGEVSEYNISGTICHTQDEVKSAIKELNKEVSEQSDILRKNVYGEKKNIVYPISLNGITFNISILLTRKVAIRNGQTVVNIEKEVTYSSSITGDNPIESQTKSIDKLIDFIKDEIITGKQAKEENAFSVNNIDRLEKENILMREREGKPFAHQEELDKARALVDEYTKKMQEELAEKEAKYADKSKNAVNLDKMDSEEDATDTPEAQYDELDYDSDNLTDAQQLATDAVMQALDNAGIETEVVSEKTAIAEVEKEKPLGTEIVELMSSPLKVSVVPSDFAAKVQKNLQTTKEKYIKIANSTKNAVSDIAKALGAQNTGTSNYVTIEAKNGKVFTLRISNHNATVSNFDNNGESNGISIVISRKPNTQIENNGKAHIVEFFYSDKALNKAKGTPIADIIGELEQTLYSGEYTDPTGLAQVQEVNIPAELETTEFSIRTSPAPKRTGIGYKVFYRGKDGKLYPPMVANPNGADTPVGVWLNADAAPITGNSKTGRPQVKAGGKGTQGGSGQLAYRPGWHLGEIPFALQFNRKDQSGNKTLFPKDFVWAEVEYAADVDYQQEAEKEGITENGKYRHSYAGLKYLPTDGFYRYRTNPNPETDPWIITGAMKVNRVLSSEEVDELVQKAGREPQQREFFKTSNGTVYGYAKGGKIYLTEKGINPNTPIHEYAHLWAKAMRKNNPKGWQSVVEQLKGTPMWDEVVNDPNYQTLEDDNAIASEVLARYSGKRGAERMENTAQQLISQAETRGEVANAVSLIQRVKKALQDFWKWVGTNLFDIKDFRSAEEVADRVLYDMLNGTDIRQREQKNTRAELDIRPDETLGEYARRIVEAKRKQNEEEVEFSISEAPTPNPYETRGDYVARFKMWYDQQHTFVAEREYVKAQKEAHGKMENILQYVADRYRPLQQFQEFILSQGGSIRPSEQDADGNLVRPSADAYQDTTLATGRAGYQMQRFASHQLQDMADAIADILNNHALDGIDIRWNNIDTLFADRKDRKNGKPLTPRELIGIYAQAKDCQEAIEQELPDRGAAGFLKNLQDQDGNPISHQDVIRMVESVVPAEKIKTLWDAIHAATQFSLDYQLAKGIIDQETHDRYTRRYYVPERGWRERDLDGRTDAYVEGRDVQLNGNPYNSALKKAHGRESIASDPFAYIQSIAETTILSAERNSVKQKFLQLLLDNQEIGMQSGAWQIRRAYVVRMTDPSGVEQQVVTYEKPANDDDIITTIVPESMIEQRTRDERLQHRVAVMRDGQQYIIELQDEALANALNSNFQEARWLSNSVANVARTGVRYMSAINTQYNPAFALWNLYRDLQIGLINNIAKEDAAFTARFVKNISAVQPTIMRYILSDRFKGEEDFGSDTELSRYLQEYFESGAQTGFSYMRDIDTLGKEFDKMLKTQSAYKKAGKAAIGTLSIATELSELTVRFAEFATARQMGFTTEEAAAKAKEISVNFDRKGLLGGTFSGLYSFFNAAIQGSWNILRSLNNPRARRTYIAVAALYTALGVVNTLLNPDDPDDEVFFSDYDRQTNFLFGKIKLPVTHFFRMFFAAGVNLALFAQNKKTGKQTARDIVKFTMDEVIPASILQIQNAWGYNPYTDEYEWDWTQYIQQSAPSIISPVTDVALNRDFKGSTVHREPFLSSEKGKLKNVAMEKRNTPTIYHDIANNLHRLSGGNPDIKTKGYRTDGWIDINPNDLQHLVEGYFGGSGAFFGDLYSTAVNAAQGEFDPTTVPVLNRAFRPYQQERSYTQQYWLLKNRVDAYEKWLKDTKKNDPQTYRDEVQSDLYKTYQNANKTLGRMKKPSDELPYRKEETKGKTQQLMQLNVEWNKAQ